MSTATGRWCASARADLHLVRSRVETAPSFDSVARLGDELAARWRTPVDVVDLERASLELRGRIAGSGRRPYSVDEPRRVRFEADTRVRWIEFRPVVEETTTAYLRRVAADGLR